MIAGRDWRRRRLAGWGVAAAVLAGPGFGAAQPPTAPSEPAAATPVAEGLTAQPCAAGSSGRSDVELAFARASVADGPIDPAVLKPFAEGAAERARAEALRRRTDWPDLCRYRAQNQALEAAGGARVVFLGDSITELWQAADPALFTAGVVDRGVSGQTSGQALLRFYDDVVALHPKVVHLLIGTNDIAGNNGPSRPEDLQNNIRAMVELARANNIQIVLASITPAAAFSWRPAVRPAGPIAAMNRWLSGLAAREGLIYVDYASVLAGPDGGMRDGLSRDGVHPLIRGYALMKPLALEAIAKALRAAR